MFVQKSEELGELISLRCMLFFLLRVRHPLHAGDRKLSASHSTSARWTVQLGNDTRALFMQARKANLVFDSSNL